MTIKMYEESMGEKAITQDIPLKHHSKQCDADCFAVVKQYYCGCRVKWSSHVCSGQHVRKSRTVRQCNKGGACLRVIPPKLR